MTAGRLVQDRNLGLTVIVGPTRPAGVFYSESVPEGTKLRFVLDFQPKGMARLLGPMIQQTMDDEVSQPEAAKTVLEMMSSPGQTMLASTYQPQQP